MSEEYITVNQYMKMYKLGYETVIDMINKKQVEYITTPAGKYRIKVGNNTVSKEVYEKEKERRIKAEAKLDVLKNILIERNE